MKVLYIEDDPRDADITVRTLGKTAPQIQFEIVSTIRDALGRLERLPSDPLDLVLCDFHLRDGDGISLLKHIRQNGLPLAFVVVTGMGDEETAVAALKSHADDYVAKRKDYLDRLPTTLQSALNHYRSETARRESPLNVLFAERELADIESAHLHLATHAKHIHLDVVRTEQELVSALQHEGGKRRYDVALLSLSLSRLSALEVLKEMAVTHKSDMPVVLLCNPGDEQLAQQGLSLGATSYLVKGPGYLFQLPWELEDAHSRAELARREAALQASERSLKKALDELETLKDRLEEENIYLKEEVKVAGDFGEMIGQSESLRQVLQLAQQVAPLDTSVLILGETGTGKELLAHAIHERSPRRNHPLVKVNCATLPGDLIESELFGHEKGAFTGADARRKGRFEIANLATIFLDEVGELPLDLQTKLLRVLQEGEFEPVGSSRTVHVNVRIIAATNRDLLSAVREGSFRSDLYYRLSIFPVTLPPLRERQGDIPILVRHFVKEFCQKFGKTIDTIPVETMARLKNYPWPGNIRELRNVIERAVIITSGSKLQLFDSLDSLQLAENPTHSQAASPGGNGKVGETLEQSQHDLILSTLKRTYWRIEGPYGAAAALKVHPSTLRSLMKKLGITRPRIKAQTNGQF